MKGKEAMKYFKELDRKAKRAMKQMEMISIIEMEIDEQARQAEEKIEIDRYISKLN